MFDSFSIASIVLSILAAVFIVVLLLLAKWVISLRTVVPTNMEHIVQAGMKTTPYGFGKPAGNTYYKWPSWIPVIGTTTTEFPECIFQVTRE